MHSGGTDSSLISWGRLFEPLAVLDRLGIDRVICLGVSMGEGVTLNLARLAPHLVRSGRPS